MLPSSPIICYSVELPCFGSGECHRIGASPAFFPLPPPMAALHQQGASPAGPIRCFIRSSRPSFLPAAVVSSCRLTLPSALPARTNAAASVCCSYLLLHPNGMNFHERVFPEKPTTLLAHDQSVHDLVFHQSLVFGQRSMFSARTKNRTTNSAASSDAPTKVSGESEKKNIKNSAFPNGFESLVLDVCDETDVAELKLKVGDFEMHLKRNVGALKSPPHIVSPTMAPPIPSEPMAESVPVAPPITPPNPPQGSTNPFSNVSSAKTTKLASLEASGIDTYALVPSPTVGSFRSGRTINGKTQPPCCKEGDFIQEGQIIGYLDQIGNELPVKSDIAGEVLKILFKDGEAVGYGDPLVAVLPSFHDINT